MTNPTAPAGDALLRLAVRLLNATAATTAADTDADPAGDDEQGQATAEYALVLLGAAAIALLLVSWATKTNVVGKLLDLVFGHLTDRATKAG